MSTYTERNKSITISDKQTDPVPSEARANVLSSQTRTLGAGGFWRITPRIGVPRDWERKGQGQPKGREREN